MPKCRGLLKRSLPLKQWVSWLERSCYLYQEFFTQIQLRNLPKPKLFNLVTYIYLIITPWGHEKEKNKRSKTFWENFIEEKAWWATLFLISHLKDSRVKSRVEDLHPFNKAKVYSLEQSEIAASWTWIKLWALESKSLKWSGQVNLSNLILYSGFRLEVLDRVVFYLHY